MSLRFHEDAQDGYLDAIRFYGRATDRFAQAVDTAIAQIRGDPERFREVEPGVRSCRVPNFPYSVLYTRDDQRVLVLALAGKFRSPASYVTGIAFALRVLGIPRE
ncbi:MAG: type II toxin-antitoxin system RelE/ParE family toxin [Verrucomicrobia bacterium]|nr:type II toxin-antitoxin system RelE/ParE family toxin [Verrucomicrobiota bacterium]